MLPENNPLPLIPRDAPRRAGFCLQKHKKNNRILSIPCLFYGFFVKCTLLPAVKAVFFLPEHIKE